MTFNDSRTILQDFTSQLIHALDSYRGITWKTDLAPASEGTPPKSNYWKLTVNGTFILGASLLTFDLQLVGSNGGWSSPRLR